MEAEMSRLQIFLYFIALPWVLLVGAVTLGMTLASKRGREWDEQHRLDEELGEE
jgi:hypothetical protein